MDGEEFEVAAGDFMGFPTPGVAHHLSNPSNEHLVYLVGGENLDVEIAVFPHLGRRMIRRGQEVEFYDISQRLGEGLILPSRASGFRFQASGRTSRTVVAKVRLWGEVDQYLSTALSDARGFGPPEDEPDLAKTTWPPGRSLSPASLCHKHLRGCIRFVIHRRPRPRCPPKIVESSEDAARFITNSSSIHRL